MLTPASTSAWQFAQSRTHFAASARARSRLRATPLAESAKCLQMPTSVRTSSRTLVRIADGTGTGARAAEGAVPWPRCRGWGGPGWASWPRCACSRWAPGPAQAATWTVDRPDGVRGRLRDDAGDVHADGLGRVGARVPRSTTRRSTAPHARRATTRPPPAPRTVSVLFRRIATTVTVDVNGDATPERDETFKLVLSNPTRGRSTTAPARRRSSTTTCRTCMSATRTSASTTAARSSPSRSTAPPTSASTTRPPTAARPPARTTRPRAAR